MGSLSRPTSSGSSATAGSTASTGSSAGGRTRVLVVGGGSRSVRPSDTAPPRATRLAATCAITLGSLLLLWLVGLLGFRLGYAPAARVPELMIDPAAAFASGAMMLIAIPGCILDAGLDAPLPLMGILSLMAVPAGALAAARPGTPGGPRLKPMVAGLASSGAVLAMLAAIAAIAWTGLSLRTDRLTSIPIRSGDAEAWFHGIRAVAGFDLAVTGAVILFTVLLIRLPIVLWMRVLGLCVTGFALCVTVTASSVSLGTAAHMGAAHTVVRSPVGERALLLGHTPQQIALLSHDDRLYPAPATAPNTGSLHVKLISRDANTATLLRAEARGSVVWFASGQDR